MRSRRREPHPELVRQAEELGAPLAETLRRLREVGTPAGADLDLGRDQLADERAVEVAPDRGGLELLEAVYEPERLGIEDRELLLDREREVLRLVESFPGETQRLIRARALRLCHRAKVSKRKY